MKVRITKCSKKSWWYNDRIGEVFEVVGETGGNYRVDDDGNTSGFVDKVDCEVMPKFNVGDTVKVLDASGFISIYQDIKEAVVKNMDDLDSIELIMKDGASQWIGHWHLEAMDKPKFSIGSKVLITQPNHWLNGKTGTIIAPCDSKTYPWRVETDGGDRGVFEEKYMELIVEEQCTPTDKQWFTKAEALHMALDGAKIINENWASCGSYVSFDGKNFRFGESNMIANGVLDYDGHWKLWQPPTSPKFTNGTFVVDECGDYMRVIESEFVDGRYKYYLASGKECTKEFCHRSWELELTEA